ncbi:acetate--CoA ligase [Cycloclasticus sp. 46_83_sub15_T18]|nr:acetate--CoA ligase [Cycloclasticus sp. 46_83_sub15_T18]
MSESHIFKVSSEIAASAHINAEKYQADYQRSIEDSEGFWAEKAKEFLTWSKGWDTTLQYDFPKGEVKWFDGGKLNVSVNCLDRHLEKRGDQPAIIWESDEPSVDKTYTYKELHAEVCRFANGLKSLGVQKGDRVCIYMPMVAEAAIAMLACTRIGAVHSVVFGGFSADALKDRLIDSETKLLIVTDESVRGGKTVPLKANADKAVASAPLVEHMLVIKRSGGDVGWTEGRDVWYHELAATMSADCPAEEMDAEDPLFILYTSGSTGKPKGVVHTTGGYLLHAAMTHKYVFDYHDGDVYWCTADVGWVTGHSYIVYGPLANGAQTLMFEGVPTYPDASRFWRVVEKHKVNIFYTAPTAIRALMAKGEEPVNDCDLSSLRVLGSVGEPINPEAWEWYHRVVGKNRCPIVDTWWQTETGGVMLTPLPGATDLKPGSAMQPFFGVEPALVDNEGNEVLGNPAEGILIIKKPWPGMFRTLYGDHQRFIDTYFANYPGNYFPGDGARRDEDGHYWITGRVDDVINVSGHRMGTAEVESALVLHEAVAEAAVVGFPHEIKGQGIYAYVTLMDGVETTDELMKELVQHVRKEIGPIASPDIIQWAPGLPKTRSGKIMRRILRKIAENLIDELGDTSTLADPSVVDDLVHTRPNK